MPAQTVRVTLDCNHGCVFCFADWTPEQRTAARRDAHDWTNLIGCEWRRELDEIRAAGYDELSISGGEPMLYPHLLPMVRHAKNLGFRRIEVQTNATLLTQGNVDRLVRAGTTSVMAALPSHVEKVFSAVTRTRDHYRAAVEGIRNLLAAGVETIVCHVICSANYRLLPEFVRFAVEALRNINEVLFFYVQPEGRAAHHASLLPRLSAIQPFWHDAMSVADRLGLPFRTDSQTGLPLCQMNGHEDRVKLEDLLDPRTVFGTDISSYAYMQSHKRKGVRCSECFFDPVCFGFWSAYLDRHGEAELVAVPVTPRLCSRFPVIAERQGQEARR